MDASAIAVKFDVVGCSWMPLLRDFCFAVLLMLSCLSAWPIHAAPDKSLLSTDVPLCQFHAMQVFEFRRLLCICVLRFSMRKHLCIALPTMPSHNFRKAAVHFWPPFQCEEPRLHYMADDTSGGAHKNTE